MMTYFYRLRFDGDVLRDPLIFKFDEPVIGSKLGEIMQSFQQIGLPKGRLERVDETGQPLAVH